MEQAKKCIDTTLCYVQNDKNQYLMLHRLKNKNDYNHDKWIGIGGKLENGETPTQCVLREVQEETGLTLLDCVYRGVIHFTATQCPTECMHLFTATKFCGEQRVCDEGDLQWVNVCDLHKYPMWQGDKIFLRLLQQNEPFFQLHLFYQGEQLVKVILNGNDCPIE